jgi:hypothetical protein
MTYFKDTFFGICAMQIWFLNTFFIFNFDSVIPSAARNFDSFPLSRGRATAWAVIGGILTPVNFRPADVKAKRKDFLLHDLHHGEAFFLGHSCVQILPKVLPTKLWLLVSSNTLQEKHHTQPDV